jgi:hypothetical protein
MLRSVSGHVGASSESRRWRGVCALSRGRLAVLDFDDVHVVEALQRKCHATGRDISRCCVARCRHGDARVRCACLSEGEAASLAPSDRSSEPHGIAPAADDQDLWSHRRRRFRLSEVLMPQNADTCASRKCVNSRSLATPVVAPLLLSGVFAGPETSSMPLGELAVEGVTSSPCTRSSESSCGQSRPSTRS